MSEEKQQEAKTEAETSTKANETSDKVNVEVKENALVQVKDVAADAPADESAKKPQENGAPRGRGGHQNRRRNPRRARRGGRRNDRARSEFDQKIIGIRRVTRVMAGGRRFSFSVSMVIGNKKGKVGVGVGKAGDTQLAIEKAARNARKNLIVVPMNKNSRIPHDVHVKYASSEVMIMPAPGRGLVAGSSVRTVLEMAGVKDVTAKIFSRSKNKLNNARAAVEALKQLKS
jgi:small subunit ribosomal protein S5